MRHAIALIVAMLFAGTALADDPVPAADQPAAGGGEKLTVTVLSVSGAAQYRSVADETGQWLPLAAGDELSELTVIRTGLGSQVVLQLADRGEITIRSATKIGIASFRQGAGQRVTARVGLKYGSIHAKVDPSKGPNDFRIRTPVATLSVRGTGGHVGFGHRGLGVNGTDGTWHNNTSSGDTTVDAGETSDENGTPSGDLDDENRDTQTGDTSGGLSDEEKNNLNNNGGGRGGFGFTGGGQSNTSLTTPGTAGSSSSNNGQNGHKGEE